MLEIVRYRNRKLYNKNESKYLTLVSLRNKIKEGAEVKVTDYKTGTDITAKTLAAAVSTLNLNVAQLQKLIKGELQ
jgi:polyhydroxyalkanoate synthesis regulator protein